MLSKVPQKLVAKTLAEKWLDWPDEEGLVYLRCAINLCCLRNLPKGIDVKGTHIEKWLHKVTLK